MQHQIYFCNIQIKRMQHTSETPETYGCNMCSSAYCLGKWRLVDTELNAGAELDATEWRGGRRCGAKSCKTSAWTGLINTVCVIFASMLTCLKFILDGTHSYRRW